METNQMLFYEALRFFIGPLLAVRFRLKIEGQDNVPDVGAAVIVCNHRSFIDPLILAYSVRNRFINFAAASWSWKIPVYGHLHQWLGAFPVSLTGGEGVEEQLARGIELLEQGEIVGVFPEGGETIFDPSGVEKINRFKTGFARLALAARVPVIPAAIIGLGERRLLRVPGPLVEKIVKHPKSGKGYSSVIYRKAICRIGVPIDLGDLYDREVDKELLEMIATKTRQIVVKLYNGEDLDRFLTGEVPFDFAYERVGGPEKKLL